MGYRIYASLEDGRPTLRIVDARSNAECLNWRFQGENTRAAGGQKEMQRLFRDLLLLSCKQGLADRPDAESSDTLGPAGAVMAG
ncbi:MAG: hypothetical protein WBO47_06900 [Gammaproteobacteria bacterium]